MDADTKKRFRGYYEKMYPTNMHFFKDFIVLFIKLKDRTAKEENVFFNEFEKLMGHRL